MASKILKNKCNQESEKYVPENYKILLRKTDEDVNKW
jgi:hypothetical protein